MVEILGYTISLTIPELLAIIAIFALFLIVTRKIVKTVFNMIWIAIASALFPFVMRFLGFNFSADIRSIILFVALGIGLYFVYVLGNLVYGVLRTIKKVGKAATAPIVGERKSKKRR